MEHHARERHVARILCGSDRLVLSENGVFRPFWLRPVTPQDRYLASEVFAETAEEAELNGLLTDAEALSLLVDQGLWTDEDEKTLKTATDNIDNLKADMFRMALREREREVARSMLGRTRALQAELLARKHQFDFKTTTGVAAVARGRFLVGRCLLRDNKEPVWTGDSFWREESSLLDNAVQAFTRTRLSEAQLRELARNEPWRSIWSCRHSEGSVFGKPAAELSDEQRLLTVWSRLYDNSYEDPECPPDDVVNDDDMFDGWMIVRRRQREKDVRKRRAESTLENKKIAESGEVFIVGAMPGEAVVNHTPADIAAIEDMNDEQAAGTKAERMAAIKRAGAIHEHHLPDSRRDIAAQFAAGMRERAKK